MANHPEITDVAAHLREILRRDIGAHLRAAHGLADADVPKMKTAQASLHASLHEDSLPPAAKATVRKSPAATPAKAAPAKPPAAKAAPKVPAAKAPAKPAPARRAPASAKPTATAKPPARKATAKAPAKAPAAKAPAKANGKAPAPAVAFNKQALAKRLIDLVAEWAKDESPEAKAKLAYWLHGLPTGGPDGEAIGGPARYWPASLPRPTTSGWTYAA